MILAILQARASSTRLPGKVLLPILGQPMIQRQLERVQHSKLISKLVLATSDDPTDDPLEALCHELGIPCYRGSLTDVLDRFYHAALPYGAEHIVRLTGDCPLADPHVIDSVIQCQLDEQYQYTSNALEPTYPDGLDVEVFRFECLEEAWMHAKLPSEREHVTPYIHTRRNQFRVGHVKSSLDLSALRWTVDERADFELVSKIYAELYPTNPAFTTADIINYLEVHPELKVYNTVFQRNEGYQSSLRND